jgi:hypothetical protein
MSDDNDAGKWTPKGLKELFIAEGREKSRAEQSMQCYRSRKSRAEQSMQCDRRW